MFSIRLSKILSNRSWYLRFSFIKRKCYISGNSIWCSLAYKGVKPDTSYLDNIWLCKQEYLHNLSHNNL